MGVKRVYSNKLLDFKKEGEEFDELSPSVFSNFNERYLNKFFEGKDNKYLKKHFDHGNITLRDDSLFYGGLDFLRLLQIEEPVYAGLSLSFLFETRVSVFADILQRLKSSDSSFDDEFFIHSKKLNWTLLSYTTYHPTDEDSFCLVGEESFVEHFKGEAEKFKSLYEKEDYRIEVHQELIKQFPSS